MKNDGLSSISNSSQPNYMGNILLHMRRTDGLQIMSSVNINMSTTKALETLRNKCHICGAYKTKCNDCGAIVCTECDTEPLITIKTSE